MKIITSYAVGNVYNVSYYGLSWLNETEHLLTIMIYNRNRFRLIMFSYHYLVYHLFFVQHEICSMVTTGMFVAAYHL